jgi:hypothetical protein
VYIVMSVFSFARCIWIHVSATLSDMSNDLVIEFIVIKLS